MFLLFGMKLQISRQMQKDIREEAFARAQAAGFEVRLELHYPQKYSSSPDKRRLLPFFPFPAVRDSPDEIWPPVFDFVDG